MDHPQEELQRLGMFQILKESVSIPRHSPRTFSLLTLTLVFPLSFAIFVHSHFANFIIHVSSSSTAATSSHLYSSSKTLLLYFLYDFLYLLFLFTFSLLSTGAIVFTVASLYTSKPISFSSSLCAIPLAFRRLFVTFVYISLLMCLYYLALLLVFGILVVLLIYHKFRALLVPAAAFLLSAFFLPVHIYITALWHLASVITVLEPVHGFGAMKKSYQLLRGKTWHAGCLVLLYFLLCNAIGFAFDRLVVKGRHKHQLWVGIAVGGLLLVLLVMVNLVGLLVQSVFYYVCKSYHNQAIDKTALHEHLGGYLGEYAPLKGNIQMENLNSA